MVKLPTDLGKPKELANSNFIRQLEPTKVFSAKLAAKNEQLDELDIVGLSIEEFCGARLYTGPMFMKYNIVLRGLPDAAAPHLKIKMEEMCFDNRCATPPPASHKILHEPPRRRQR